MTSRRNKKPFSRKDGDDIVVEGSRGNVLQSSLFLGGGPVIFLAAISVAIVLASHQAILGAPTNSDGRGGLHGRGLVLDGDGPFHEEHGSNGRGRRVGGRAGTERFAVSNRVALGEPNDGGEGNEGPLINPALPTEKEERAKEIRPNDDGDGEAYRFPYYDAPPLHSDMEPTPPLNESDLSAVVERTNRRSKIVNGRLEELRRRKDDGNGNATEAGLDFATKRVDGGNRDISSFACPSLDDDKYRGTDGFHRYEWYSKASTWEDAGQWLIKPSDFNSMVVQLVRSFPQDAKFERGDRVYESACGSGLFLTALEDAVEIVEGKGRGELDLSMHGSDIVANSMDMIKRAVYPDGTGTFCPADSHDLTHIPPNNFDWSVTGFLEPMRTNSRSTAERWMRWWVYHMARIAKPNGWILVAFNYQPGSEHEGSANVEDVNWWRKVRQTSLWRVRPESVQIVWQSADWPKRKHTKHRYHVLMRRDDTPFGEGGCDHVKFRAKVDPDYQECRFTGEESKEGYAYEPLEEFMVAGRNLASSHGPNGHSLLEARVDGSSNDAAHSFKLYRDFYMGNQLLSGGGEESSPSSWDDLARKRWRLTSRTSSFYADKAAQKSWLSETMGVDVPRAYALKYASELIEDDRRKGGDGDGGDEGDDDASAKRLATKIEGLLPRRDVLMDYVVKPTRSSGAEGVRLVSLDGRRQHLDYDEEKTAMVGFQRDPLLPSGGKSSSVMRQLALPLAEYLTSEPSSGDSMALRNVRLGFIIEERFVTPTMTRRNGTTANDALQHPLELEVLCLWGRVWMSTFRRGETVFGLVRRDGTMADIESPREVPGLPHWVDWDRVVDIAERLAHGKDMIRVDVLVGVPAEELNKAMEEEGGGGLENGGKNRQEDHLRMRYVVTEVEFQPVAEWMGMPSDVLEEGARLWTSGYEMLNLELVENEEVPESFLNGNS
eukprot:CAMPEP_0113568552 /NCGR_PEP_ID=MMETSP0015_2-20120614/23911_1 /TAXON_ID=2838 /ORGANISM="Odontella" /LENGTH=943 /DNA_ID=CAMNT_0000471103 /DNA_START=26 /DNA_END=2857 /DNA_ORIENTATION=- /assembly_acc=CAM_ASM_000160